MIDLGKGKEVVGHIPAGLCSSTIGGVRRG